MLEKYLKNLSPYAEKHHYLWKTLKRFNRPIAHIPPIRSNNGQWMRTDSKKAEIFANYLATGFQLPRKEDVNLILQCNLDYKSHCKSSQRILLSYPCTYLMHHFD